MPVSGQPFADITQQQEGAFGPVPEDPNARVDALTAIGEAGAPAAPIAPPAPAFVSLGPVGQRVAELNTQFGGQFEEQPPFTPSQQMGLMLMAMGNPEGAMDIIRTRRKERARRSRQRAEMNLRMLDLAQTQLRNETEVQAKNYELQLKMEQDKRDAIESDARVNESGARAQLYRSQADEDTTTIEEDLHEIMTTVRLPDPYSATGYRYPDEEEAEAIRQRRIEFGTAARAGTPLTPRVKGRAFGEGPVGTLGEISADAAAAAEPEPRLVPTTPGVGGIRQPGPRSVPASQRPIFGLGGLPDIGAAYSRGTELLGFSPAHRELNDLADKLDRQIRYGRLTPSEAKNQLRQRALQLGISPEEL